MMKKCFVFLLVFLLLFFFGCENNRSNTDEYFPLRFAEKYDGWDISAVGELDLSKCKRIPKVAIIDTGCDITYQQITLGYNVVTLNDNIMDTTKHGTFIVSKLLTLNSKIEIMVIKVADEQNKIDSQMLQDAINFAIQNGAEIINISLATNTDYQNIKEAINKAAESNIIVIASSGDAGENSVYPADYSSVISVMARDINNKEIYNGNKNAVHKKSFSAPGEHVICLDEYVNGTSISTVFITAAVAYIKSIREGITINEVLEILKNSCNYPTESSFGFINFVKLNKLFS